MSLWESVQKNMTWRGVAIASFVAATVFLIVNATLTTLIFELDPAMNIRYFASLLLGSDVLINHSPLVLGVGILVHYVLSFVFTLLITIVVHRWGLIVGIVGGGILGLALYGINLFTMTLIFDWFFAIEGPVLLVSHLIFGMTAGGVYELFDHYDLGLGSEVSHETA